MSKTPQELAAELNAAMSDVAQVADHQGIPFFMDTSIPELNFALSGDYNGGIPSGRCIEIFGPASCGKTFLSSMVMRSAQQMGGMAIFADHELAYDPILAASLGVDVENPLTYRYLKPMTLEQSFDSAAEYAEKVRKGGFIPDDAPIVYVIDSLAMAVPHKKLFDDNGNRRSTGSFKMNDYLELAKATSQGMPTVNQFAGRYNMTVLVLNQIRLKPGVMYGDSRTTPGGQAMEFVASTRLSIGRQEITNGKKGKDKEVFGFQITAKTVKNKVARPFVNAQWQVRFNAGGGCMIDQVATNLDFLIRKGIIEKSGSRVSWDGKKMFQSQVETLLKADPKGNERLLAMFPTGEDELEDVQDSGLDKESLGDVGS